MSLKIHFLSVFREIFVSHHKSLEFRAKVFAAMLLAKKNQLETDYEIIKIIAKEIYGEDVKRIEILASTVKEYVEKAKFYKSLNLDSLLKEIDTDFKIHQNYVKKIDFSHLRRLIAENENDALIQQRVYEFFVSEVKRYTN